MPHILHVIEYLDKGGATRATLSTAKQSTKLGPFEHSIISLKKAHPEALELAREANVQVHEAPSIMQIDGLIDEADILQIEYWNAPAINHLLHASLPPSRLAIWFHIVGTSSPQRIHEQLYNFADIPIACAPTPFNEHPLFKHAIDTNHTPEPGLVTAPADFDRLKNLSPVEHEGFNIGYIGSLSFVKMHRDFISMSANIEIPGAKFIVCGDDNLDELKSQAASLNAAERFEFPGYVKDIKSVLEVLDVYGYPLSEDTSAAAELNLQEVMYAGIPPIVFPHGGAKGLIQHNRTGLFVTNKEDYRRAIEYLYYNPVERKRLGVNAAAYARAHFGEKNAARSMNKIYERLLTLPKRYHTWGEDPQEFAPKLSHKMPGQKPASDVFIESLGPSENVFVLSKHESDLFKQLEADQHISKSSYHVFETGIHPYLMHTPTDPYLNLWAGLYQEEQGNYTEAISSYAAAISADLEDWRVQWYLGRTLKKQGKIEEAKRVYSMLRQHVPDFEVITQDVSFAQSESVLDDYSKEAAPVLDASQPKEESNNRIRVSAIVSTYNAESFMEGCMQNLIDQSLYKDGELEIIVVDACSEENEKEIVARYKNQFEHISYVRAKERETLYASWNRAIQLAQGTYITSANTDDRHRKDALEKLANYLDDYEEIALVYPGQIDTGIPNETFENTSSTKVLDWPVYSYEELERHCIIGSQPMWRRSLHEKYGLFRDSFKSAGDYEFWLRAGKSEKFFRYPETLGLYYRNPKGIEHGSDTSQREALQIWTEYGMFERGIPVILNGRIVTSPDILNEKPPTLSSPTMSPKTSPSSTAQSLDLYITQFEEHLVKNEHQHALTVAQHAIQEYSDIPYPYILKAIALRQLEDYSNALITLEKSINLQETPEALVELVQLSISTANLEEAYRTQIYIRENYPEWSQRLDYVKIPDHSEQKLQEKSSQPPAPHEAADIIELINTSPSDENMVIQLNQANPLSVPAGLEDLDYTVKSFEDLRAEFEKLIKVSDVQHAEQLALAATRKFPDNSEAWILKATSYRLKGSYQEAKEAIQQSLLLKDSPEALIELLELSISLGDEQESLKIADAITRSYPEYNGQISELLKKNQLAKRQKRTGLHPAIYNFVPINREKSSQIQQEDICIVSFPGSGSSWLCTLLADTLQQAKGYPTKQAKLAVPPADIITDLHNDEQRSSWLQEHNYPFQLFKSFDIAGISDQKIIYLFRDPIESLISAYHYCKHVPYLQFRSATSCDSFCAANIENYNLHLNAALILKEANPERVLLLNAKDVSSVGSNSFETVHRFMNVPYIHSTAIQAFKNCDMEQYLMDKTSNTPLVFSSIDFLQPGNELSRLTLDAIVTKLLPVYQDACKQAGSYQEKTAENLILTMAQPV